MENEYHCLLTIILTLPYIKCLLHARYYFLVIVIFTKL